MTPARGGWLAPVLRIVVSLFLCLALATPLAAQEDGGRIDYDTWQRVSQNAESRLDTGDLNISALEILRGRITQYRATFLAAQDTNKARIQTLQSQLDALGPEPSEGEESERSEITNRRETLNAELSKLREPVVTADAAYTRANGLVAEIDRQIRDAEARRLLAREPTPLNPVHWSAATQALGEAGVAVGTEIARRLADQDARRNMLQGFSMAVPLAVIGLMLIIRSRWWIRLLAGWAISQSRRGRGVIGFLLSLGQILLPLGGVYLVSLALDLTGLLGPIGGQYADGLVLIALPILLTKWLTLRLFPCDADPGGPLMLPMAFQSRFRRLGNTAGVVIAFIFALRLIAEISDRADVAVAVLLYLPRLLLALLLYRIGHHLLAVSARPEGDEPERRLVGTFGRALGRLTMVAAISGAALATLGYANAAGAILPSAAMTLGLTAILVLFQRLVYDTYALLTDTAEGGTDALAPVLIGIGLSLSALPVYALIWGARLTDLTEIWSRFLAGFAIGQTRISPTDFIMFGLVFLIGYGLTRFIQGMLRSSVLPKTRLDVGGRNAIVAGVGYIGIALAAIMAVTSAGINLSSIAIVAGALSVGIGFGLQTIVSNFVSGIILLIERPISEGDWIQVNGQMGYVRDISVRSTRIETFDRTDVIVPNADLVSGTVTNWTRGNLVGRVIVPVGVAHGTDTRKVEAILQDVAEAHPMVVMNPEPVVLMMGFGVNALNFEIRAFIRDINFMMLVMSDMNHEISRRFAEAAIEIPFAQHDLWMHEAPDRPRQGAFASPESPERRLRRPTIADGDAGSPDGEGR